MEKYKTGTGQIISVHDAENCKGTCPIHNPSDHPMKDFPTHWRDDRQIMERICPHGVGHPDPDDFRIRNGEDRGVHGCDGCCTGDHPIKTEPDPLLKLLKPLPKGQTIEPDTETVNFQVGRQKDHLIYYGDGSCYDTKQGQWVTLVEAIPTMNPDDVLVLKLPAHIKFPRKDMEKFIKIQTDNLKRIFPNQKIIVLTDGIEIEIQNKS
jgi:hypothetical protein